MAITTKYDGIEYRSRLEARWAAFMKNIGWDIVYEPFDGDGYIPDFLVQGDRPLLIEVKPAVTQAEYEAAVPKAEKGLADHWDHDILIVGASPFMTPPRRTLPNGKRVIRTYPHFGWIGQNITELHQHGYYLDQKWDWGQGHWAMCRACGGFSVFHAMQTRKGRPCWCEWPDDGEWSSMVRVNLLESFWADACNDVKWRGRAA